MHQPSVHRLNVRMARAPSIETSGCIACAVWMSRIMRASHALIRRCYPFAISPRESNLDIGRLNHRAVASTVCTTRRMVSG
jgi:hypothetical protein